MGVFKIYLGEEVVVIGVMRCIMTLWSYVNDGSSLQFEPKKTQVTNPQKSYNKY